MRVWPPRLRESWTVQLRARSSWFLQSYILRVGSYEDNQTELKVLKPVFCVFLGSNVNLECHIKLSNLGFLSVSTMANSLIAVVSYCMHCKVCMHLNHGICTSSTNYLYCLFAYDMLHFHWICHFHTQPVSYCKSIMQDHVTQLRQSSMLKLALFPGSHSPFYWYSQWLKESCHSTCVYTLLAKQLYKL